MDTQNLAYALTQIVHNFGAVTVVGGSVCALARREIGLHRRFEWMVLAGWLAQALSGATFGGISYYYYAKFPDLAGVAVAALIVKVACATLGVLLAAWQLVAQPSGGVRRYVWVAQSGLGVLALSSAALLRWFS